MKCLIFNTKYRVISRKGIGQLFVNSKHNKNRMNEKPKYAPRKPYKHLKYTRNQEKSKLANQTCLPPPTSGV